MPFYFRPFSSLWNNVNILDLPCYREQGQFIDWLDSGSWTHRTGNKPYCKCRIYVFDGSFHSAVFGSSYPNEPNVLVNALCLYSVLCPRRSPQPGLPSLDNFWTNGQNDIVYVDSEESTGRAPILLPAGRALYQTSELDQTGANSYKHMPGIKWYAVDL